MSRSNEHYKIPHVHGIKSVGDRTTTRKPDKGLKLITLVMTIFIRSSTEDTSVRSQREPI